MQPRSGRSGDVIGVRPVILDLDHAVLIDQFGQSAQHCVFTPAHTAVDEFVHQFQRRQGPRYFVQNLNHVVPAVGKNTLRQRGRRRGGRGDERLQYLLLLADGRKLILNERKLLPDCRQLFRDASIFNRHDDGAPNVMLNKRPETKRMCKEYAGT